MSSQGTKYSDDLPYIDAWKRSSLVRCWNKFVCCCPAVPQQSSAACSPLKFYIMRNLALSTSARGRMCRAVRNSRTDLRMCAWVVENRDHSKHSPLRRRHLIVSFCAATD